MPRWYSLRLVDLAGAERTDPQPTAIDSRFRPVGQAPPRLQRRPIGRHSRGTIVPGEGFARACLQIPWRLLRNQAKYQPGRDPYHRGH